MFGKELTDLIRGPHRVGGAERQLLYPMHEIDAHTVHETLSELEAKGVIPKDGVVTTHLDEMHDTHFDEEQFTFYAGRALPDFRPRLHMRGRITPLRFLSKGLLRTGQLNERRDGVVWGKGQNVRNDDEVIIPRGTAYHIASRGSRAESVDYVFAMPERPMMLAEDTAFVDLLTDGHPNHARTTVQ